MGRKPIQQANAHVIPADGQSILKPFVFFSQLRRSGFGLLLVLFAVIGLAVSMTVDDTPAKLYLIVGALAVPLIGLSASYPEVVLAIYLVLGTGFNLRLFPESRLPFFQYPVWVWAAAATGCMFFFTRVRVKFHLNGMRWLIILWSLSTVSLGWSDYVEFGLSKSVQFFLDLTAAIVMYNLVFSLTRLRNFLICLLTTAVSYALVVLVAAVTGTGLTISGLDKNQFGRILVTCYPIASCLRFPLAGVTSGFIAVAVMASGSRTAALTLLAVVTLSAVLVRSPREQLRHVPIIAAVVVIMALAALFRYAPDSPLLAYQLRGLDDLLELVRGGKVSSMNYRLTYLRTFVRDLNNLPRNAIGLGLGGFAVVYQEMFGEQVGSAYPHILPAEIYYELGLVGLITYVLALCGVIENSMLIAKRGDPLLGRCLVQMALAVTVFSFFSGSLDNSRAMLYVYALCAGYARYLRGVKDEQRTSTVQ